MSNCQSYVWYAGYGSNLSKQRFLCYIKGGRPKYGEKKNDGCNNKDCPIDGRLWDIPYRLYFALPDKEKETKCWGSGGVAFITLDKEENKEKWTKGWMWKITKEQYEDVRCQEGRSWYNYEIRLGEEDGVPIYTITNKHMLTNILRPSDAYLKTIALGLWETYGFTEDKIVEYLIGKEGIQGKIEKHELIKLIRCAVAK